MIFEKKNKKERNCLFSVDKKIYMGNDFLKIKRKREKKSKVIFKNLFFHFFLSITFYQIIYIL